MCRPADFKVSPKNPSLAKDEAWLEKFDLEAFTQDIRELGKKLEKNQGKEDVDHLNKMLMWANSCAFLGLGTMGFRLNVVTAFLISTWTFVRWTMIAHHTCHGGYDRCHPNKKRWHRFRFAIGSKWRRLCDWFDWMMPEAWNAEHNGRHHYNLSETEDPDLVEENLVDLREMNVSTGTKWVAVIIQMCIWKWYYYSPNTYKELKLSQHRKAGKPIPPGVNPAEAVTVRSFLSGDTAFYSVWEYMSVVFLPYLIIHFFVLPLPYIFIGQLLGRDDMYMNAVKNLFLAEIFTNIHAFIAVVPNHAGNDMYRFREGCRPHSGSFYVRQVLASVAFSMGTDLIDFMHGFLNYQIEHHLWPNLSMKSYQKSAPLVQAICRKHGIPYIKENVFIRTKKAIDIMIGTESMRWFPEEYEKEFLEIDAMAEIKKRGLVNVTLAKQ